MLIGKIKIANILPFIKHSTVVMKKHIITSSVTPIHYVTDMALQ